MKSLRETEPWLFEPTHPEFKPHARYVPAADQMEAMFIDEPYYRKVISEEVEVLAGTHSLKTVGVCLKNVKERLKDTPAQDPLLLGTLIDLYEMPAPVKKLLQSLGHAIPTPLFLCDSCKTWELYRFESTNTCDLCSLADLGKEDIPLDWV